MGAAICIGLNFVLIPIYGIIGSAIVTIITVAFAGFLANVFIPTYRPIFRLQLKALFLGWKELFKIRTLF
jgi:O-antigen/teichoic acid export membrane protein